MTQEQRIALYYRVGRQCLDTGRPADAALMSAAIRCFDPKHPLDARLRAELSAGSGPDRDRSRPRGDLRFW